MWIVAKINNNQQELFKKNFQDKFKENIKFYYPKIEGQKRFSNKSKKKINLIGNYIFCYSENFIFNSIEKFNFIKGLSYFLKNCKFYQKEIKSFVETCKAAESNDGFIKSSFFSKLDAKEFKFLNGPLADMIFSITRMNAKKVFGTLKNNKRIIIRNLSNYSILNN